ncbi:MAG: carboxymuconolactone decarboxylase family protein [Proteobacteria bacterium]|nr:carboxymuconolactone decarboxylase family protein [Pseudomonadota bacterium]
MARIEPLSDEEASGISDAFEVTRKRLGFVPNSQKTMARRPQIFDAAAKLGAAVFGPGTVDLDLKMLMALMVSRAAGCMYCQAHTGLFGSQAGVSPEKENAIWEYETSPLFSDGERAALNLALLSGHVPNAVTDEDFAAVKKHYTDEQIVEMVSVLGYMGMMNRWNDTMATELESAPREHGEEILTSHGWDVGKHAAE